MRLKKNIIIPIEAITAPKIPTRTRVGLPVGRSCVDLGVGVGLEDKVDTGDTATVGVGVRVGISVGDGVRAVVGLTVGVGVDVGVTLGVTLGVTVGIGVGVVEVVAGCLI